MAKSPKTSFIPKQDANAAPVKPQSKKKSRTFNVFNFLSMVIFLAAVILAVGVYFLERQSAAELEDRKQELSDLKETFDRSDIETLRELDRRIDTAQTLLNRHLSPSRVFDMLERRTQTEIQFRSFSYLRNESGTAAVSLSGVAPRFNTVALQSEGFSDDAVFERSIFSDMNVVFEEEFDENAPNQPLETNVVFTATGQINTEAIAFSRDAPQPSEEEADETEDATSTTTDEIDPPSSESGGDEVATSTSEESSTTTDEAAGEDNDQS